MSGVIRMTPNRKPMPSSGTFSSIGYGLDQPTPVVSYVQRPVVAPPTPQPRLQLPWWMMEQGYGASEESSSGKKAAVSIGLVTAGLACLAAGWWAYRRNSGVGG